MAKTSAGTGKTLMRLIAGMSVVCSTGVMAQDTSHVQARSNFAVSGFIDTYYSYNVARPESQMNKLRNFDVAENQVNLSLVEMVFQKQANPVGFRLDLDYGSANDLVQAGVSGTASLLQQAYVTGIVPVGNGISIDAGKFVTHMGYEVIESKDNWNYSRSLLFAWAIPYYHTGIRIGYGLSSALNASVSVVNGWNSVVDNNNSKSLGLQLAYSPDGATSVLLNLIGGHENLSAIEYGARNVCELDMTRRLTDRLSAALSADYGEARTSAGMMLWKGAAMYIRYVLTETSALAARTEVFSDPRGYVTGVGTKVDFDEFTVTWESKFADSLLLRCEARDDISSLPLFDTAQTPLSSGIAAERTQVTFLVSAVVTF